MLLLGVGDFARWVSMEAGHREEDAARHRSRRHEGGRTPGVSASLAHVRQGLDLAPQLVDFAQQTTVELLGGQQRDGLRPCRTDGAADAGRVLPDRLGGLVDGVGDRG